MFMRCGRCFGPIVEVNETHVVFEVVEPLCQDGERISLRIEDLHEYAQAEIRLFKLMQDS